VKSFGKHGRKVSLIVKHLENMEENSEQIGKI
jgi:hypothetical protein